MFPIDYISTIFGNIEQIYLFSHNFFTTLKDCVLGDNVHLSPIGKCFVERVGGVGGRGVVEGGVVEGGWLKGE